MKITYLLNSGFLIQDDKTLIVFDDYADPTHEVRKSLNSDVDRLYIFASHAHFDHFSLEILQFADQVEKFIFSYDIRRTKRVKSFPPDKIEFMKRYSEWNDDSISVKSFDSTDIGVSYLIEINGKKIFHAGDFNYWYWSGDTEVNRNQATLEFNRQMEKLDGLEADIVFFPVDGRLGEYRDIGVREFFKRTKIKSLIAMHNVGFAPWIPDRKIFTIPTWSPSKSGDSRIFEGGNFQ